MNIVWINCFIGQEIIINVKNHLLASWIVDIIKEIMYIVREKH